MIGIEILTDDLSHAFKRPRAVRSIFSNLFRPSGCRACNPKFTDIYHIARLHILTQRLS